MFLIAKVKGGVATVLVLIHRVVPLSAVGDGISVESRRHSHLLPPLGTHVRETRPGEWTRSFLRAVVRVVNQVPCRKLYRLLK